MLSILALPSGHLLQSPALVLENSLNPNQPRREAVGLLLSEAVDIPLNETDTDTEERKNVLPDWDASTLIQKSQGDTSHAIDP